ncbi:tryptophan dimethylallyltransferase family protein [Amycolatopsis sp. lyj-90]|uniref:tryptophan dimethylallyltransferase family protein n=1 Tax=Amycolatopsis sp. lyj-90 TaxID=2789285 RepID=UPI003979A7FD
MLTDSVKSWANIAVDHSLTTYRDIATTHLQLASRTISATGGFAGRQIDLVGSLLGAWADQPVEQFDRHHSFAGNDGSPVEFSCAMTRSGAEVRLLFEPLDAGRPPRPSPEAGHRFVELLNKILAIDVSRFRVVADLFAGVPSAGSCSMLCSAALRTGGTPLFKVYMNPAVGEPRPHQVVGEAMSRLGLSEQWALVAEHLRDGLGSREQEVALFALDLGDSAESRVKIYFRHGGRAPEQVERVAGLSGDHQPDLFTKILDRVYDVPVERLVKAPMTCLSFQGDRRVPVSATLYCPLDPNISDDAEASTRVVDLLEMSGIAPEPFGALAGTISGTDLACGRRLSWVSYKRPADPVVTVYAGLDGSARVS